MDFSGIILVVVGLLSLLSLISQEQGQLTGWWVQTLKQGFGLGAYLLPVSLMVIGAWLIFRNLDITPVISAERIFGIILIFFNLLTIFHLVINGNFNQAELGQGGGYVGAFFKLVLVQATGLFGSIIALIAWLLIGIIFAFDISIPDFYRSVGSIFQRGKTKTTSLLSNSKDSVPSYYDQAEGEASGELPKDFHPIRNLSILSRKKNVGDERTAQKAKPGLPDMPVPEFDGSNEFTSGTGTSAPDQSWILPALEKILDPAAPIARQANLDMQNARVIEDTLASFGVPAHVVEIHRGPTITQYGIEPDFIETRTGRTRVRVSKITSLVDDLALALAARRIRIQAPVPGKSFVGIEVPNDEVSQVTLREVMESKSFQSKQTPLRFALGKDVSGKPITVDLADMPHLLIAGTTGSGKSVCINSILSGFLLQNSPSTLKLILIDPKRVELTGYNGIPHLLAPVVVDVERVIAVLQWALLEMDRRYDKFSQIGVRNIIEYNSKFLQDQLPNLIVIIDELADLMMVSPDETERCITRLAQLARATGIHLIIATQRPSVDVVTGLIKANFPARIAFAVASGVDSRVILDQPGAERLLGRGDMLFQSPDAAAPVRLQGVYVSEVEIQRLVDYWRQAKVEHGQAMTTPQASGIDVLPTNVPFTQEPLFDTSETRDRDPLFNQAVIVVRQEKKASITLLQRKMRIGYTRAARLIDTMEAAGIISPAQSSSQIREVLDFGDTREGLIENQTEET